MKTIAWYVLYAIFVAAIWPLSVGRYVVALAAFVAITLLSLSTSLPKRK